MTLKDARKEFANKDVSVQRLGRWDRCASLFRPYLPYRQSGTMAAAFWERSYHRSVQVGEIYVFGMPYFVIMHLIIIKSNHDWQLRLF